MVDYLSKYMRDDGFDLPALVNDDLIEPVRVLWKAQHYISALKLLLCSIDTMAFLAFGNQRGAFKRWLTDFAELDSLGVTADELWEHRNGLLHTGGLDSEKVSGGKVSRLIGYIGVLPVGGPTGSASAKWFSIHGLIIVAANAFSKNIEWLNNNPNEFEAFLSRYDQIVSDARLLTIDLGE
jgi:hypothetical protein